MKILKKILFAAFIGLFAVSLTSCKSKKDKVKADIDNFYTTATNNLENATDSASLASVGEAADALSDKDVQADYASLSEEEKAEVNSYAAEKGVEFAKACGEKAKDMVKNSTDSANGF